MPLGFILASGSPVKFMALPRLRQILSQGLRSIFERWNCAWEKLTQPEGSEGIAAKIILQCLENLYLDIWLAVPLPCNLSDE
jgi:hypothetical protein